MKHVLLALSLAIGCATAAHAADLTAEVQLLNNTGQDKTSWPIFLTVYKVFGSNLDLAAINPEGFHVYDAGGKEIPHMLRQIPPDFSIGNDEIIFVVPRMAADEALMFRVTNTREKGLARMIDLVANPNNLLPNDTPRLEAAAKDVELRAACRASSEHPGFEIVMPVGTSFTATIPESVTFRKDGQYHFSFWAKTENVAYTGWGFWEEGVTVSFEPVAFRGRDSIALRGSRDWHCYSFDPGSRDDWGMASMTSMAQTETVRKHGEDVPAEIWQKAGRAALTIKGKQADQPFLKGNKTGRLWLDEILLFEQPVITVNRTKGLERVAKDGAIVFGRPVNMPRMGVFAHEAIDCIETFAMPGERRAVRFGIHAVQPLEDVQVSVSDLHGDLETLSDKQVNLEMLGEYVEEYKPLAHLPAGKAAEYLLGLDVPYWGSPGTYEGTITLRAGGETLREVPLKLEVLPLRKPREGFWIGGIYNTGMGLERDRALYECYAKTGFNYILLFDYLFPYRNGRLDFDAAWQQVLDLANIARVNGGIGLYREPNISEDQPRLWYQIAAGKPEYQGPYKIGTDPRFRAQYQRLAREAYVFARRHGWPSLLFMVSDEPSDKRDFDPSMGWLREMIPGAISLADVQFKDMIKTWQWYSLPVFDDPIDWTGPFIYDYCRQQGHSLFGFCGTGWALDVARYQPGLMLASSDARYWHFWHLRGPFEKKDGKVVRSHAVAAMGEGYNDYLYYTLLEAQIEQAHRSREMYQPTGSLRIANLRAAEGYLKGVFAFASADHDQHLMPYNGVPETWGYDRFYDDWRVKMKDFLLKVRQQPSSRPSRLERPLQHLSPER